MKKYVYQNLSLEEKAYLLNRPSIKTEEVFEKVRPILNNIKNNGLSSVEFYAKEFGEIKESIKVSKSEIENSEKFVSKEFKDAVEIASSNIEKFHRLEIPGIIKTEISDGIECSREFRPIENVGLYVPGGTAILPSTLMMLGIPAKLAGCKRIVVCSPGKKGKVSNEVLYVSKKLEIDEFYCIGGAQAVGLMAYGTEDIQKVDKIFGPGNQYVTSAKTLVSIDNKGAAIDMPAGPSEVLVIADENSNPAFVAADLLSQAEHGLDSQVILATPSEKLAESVKNEIDKQTQTHDRKDFINTSLENSFILITESIDDAIEFSNKYAPEHLILSFNKAEELTDEIINAGSVFVGEYSPESAGDYASGTNHSLPTYGYAKSYSGVSTEAFMKGITFQKLSKNGLKSLSKSIIELAESEKLEAHANAVKIRLKDEY